MKTRFRPSEYKEEIVNPDYGIECFYTTENKCSAIFYYGKKSNKTFHYSFKSKERMFEYINERMSNIIANIDSDRAEKQKRKNLNAEMVASDYYQIGDIVVNSWGYDQTNIEFYQVTEVLNKKIRVREISQNTVDCVGPMSSNVLPEKDSFLTSAEPFLLSLKMWNDKNCVIANPKSYYYFHRWNGKPQYCSWYA